jgi:hypothetical protein
LASGAVILVALLVCFFVRNYLYQYQHYDYALLLFLDEKKQKSRAAEKKAQNGSPV